MKYTGSFRGVVRGMRPPSPVNSLKILGVAGL
jgi:hypothetical protein